jgi:multidrug efflux pump subunit AcrA (membrane-fusion protein)
VCDLCAPRLLELAGSDRWIGARAADASRRLLARAVGPKHTWAKVAAVIVTALLTVALFVKGPHRVEAPFVVNPAQRVTLTAPFESYLLASDVRPGDRVVAGQTVLAELDASELRLQLSEALAERDALLAAAAVAQQEDRLGEHRIGLLQAEQVDARIDLLQWRIDRAAITAPTDGIVVSGDLRKLIGSPLESGRALFEIAPLEDLEADFFVSESDVADLQPGQSGELAPVARPADRVAFTVDRIDPVAEVVDRRNVFRVRLRLQDRPQWLRPGMEGVGRVDIDRRSYAWLWTHELIDWVRMRLWL